MSAERRYDLIVFGATGFTGQFVIENVAKTAESNDLHLKWAVAGRNDEKLKVAIKTAEKETGLELQHVGVVVADVNDKASLVSMAQQSKVVLNVVGPYRFWGEPVVKACVENGCSHVDICGEPQFLESMQLKYHDVAKENHCYVVGSCGFDSIPADVGTTFLMEKFDGDLNSVETYISTKAGPLGTKVHYGTWHSAIHGFAHSGELRDLRHELYPTRPPKPNHKLYNRGTLHKSEIMNNSWCLPFPGADRSVVTRSQYYFWSEQKQRPVQVGAYFTTSSLFSAVMTVLAAAMFALMASFTWTRSLLEKYPEFFSMGLFSHDGPTREQLKGCSFCITLHGKGWNNRLTEPSDQHTEPPNKALTVEVNSSSDPGYIATAELMVQSGLVILEEKEKLPDSGGVYPPGAAFWKTSLVDRLNKNGIVTFSVKGE